MWIDLIEKKINHLDITVLKNVPDTGFGTRRRKCLMHGKQKPKRVWTPRTKNRKTYPTPEPRWFLFYTGRTDIVSRGTRVREYRSVALSDNVFTSSGKHRRRRHLVPNGRSNVTLRRAPPTRRAVSLKATGNKWARRVSPFWNVRSNRNVRRTNLIRTSNSRSFMDLWMDSTAPTVS